uniref:Ankyrin repeat domain 39 n=1 Tax=Tetraodon nigroviridis TaxID=99883 RepID=H3D1Q0_TETNG
MMTPGDHRCSCCSGPVSSVHQTLHEMDFERGIWSAALHGDLQRVRSLVQKGTQPNLKDTAGYTAQHYASGGGHVAVCAFLLEVGACASPQTPGGATLHRAAYCGHVDVVGLLLEHGANPSLRDGDGATPLHKAAARGHREVCGLLLQSCPTLCSVTDNKLQLPFVDVLPNNSGCSSLTKA